ncbi:YggT family protein [Bacillus salipaludis]|jgi:YggT family protein|uniref:YggT family protein n=1 Tax=Bacillus salipaludis TaxID=2547811 RepID=A0A4R5W1A6_9BACI|nr:YggT family protein [Bacillus salipaludis]MDQ6596885.1 YggT family protein [Bacillus salipaludis]MED1469608.1 YggT family protein [Bacillus salipaludis]TDK64903.1 YggT family protein [Bacillus salipaludis]
MDLIFNLLIQLIGIYRWILIIYILMSWFPNMSSSQIGSFLARICEPFLEPFRRIIPPIGMMDLSPLAAFFVLYYAPVGLRALQSWIV